MRVCPKCGLPHYAASYAKCLVCKADLSETTDPRIGTVLAGRYLIEGVIGEGGMATVYRARHTLLERSYAVKILHPKHSHDAGLVERVRREARSAAALTHPNIIEVYDFGMTDDGAAFLVMELLEGQSLREIISESPLEIERLLDLGEQMAMGLARAHDFGIVHRDLKPENVFVVEDEQGREIVKIVDFGIARSPADTHLTARGEIIGTPQYMAPDRATSREPTASCDLYSLGIVLYEMATGVLPFESNSATGFVLKHIHEQAVRAISRRSHIPEALDQLIGELMEKDPADRPVDAHQVVERIRGLTSRATLPTPVPTIRPTRTSTENTWTLDGWSLRVSLFERMLMQAHPSGPPPAALDTLAAIRGSIGRLRSLREEGLGAQRELDGVEEEIRARGERLGHAVHVLALDLSRAREEAREARLEGKRRCEAARAAKAAFNDQLAALEAFAAGHPEDPSDELVSEARALTDAADGWQRAEGSRARSEARDERSASEVGDLEFQVRELGSQLANLDRRHTEIGDRSRELLERNGAEQGDVERLLVEATNRIVAPLRGRDDLAEIFTALELSGQDPGRERSSAPPA